jgi:hypothetical protein
LPGRDFCFHGEEKSRWLARTIIAPEANRR